MSQYSEEQLAEVRASVQKLHDLGLLTLIEEDPVKGYHVKPGPLLEEYMRVTGEDLSQVMARATLILRGNGQ